MKIASAIGYLAAAGQIVSAIAACVISANGNFHMASVAFAFLLFFSVVRLAVLLMKRR